jgi:hypothetical protein
MTIGEPCANALTARKAFLGIGKRDEPFPIGQNGHHTIVPEVRTIQRQQKLEAIPGRDKR